MEDMSISMPIIFVALDDHQVDYQATAVEFGGNIITYSVSILIYLVSSHSYIPPNILKFSHLIKVSMESCGLSSYPQGQKGK